MPPRRAALVLGMLLAACHASAEKRIAVKIVHSAGLAVALAGRRVTLGQVTGDCAQEFGDLLMRDMRARGVTVSSGEEHVSAALPAIALSIDVTRCEARTLAPILGGGLPAIHISRTEGWFAAAVRANDPSSGQELAAASVRGHAQKDNQSQTGSAEYPAPSEVKSLALRQGLAEAQRLYAPWTENREIPFMDNKECHLKQAYDLAKKGDYEGLVTLSRANAESCGTGSKAAGEAWYNLGVACMLVRKYDDALAAFEKASSLNDGKLAGDLIGECRKESAVQKALRPKAPPPEPGPPRQTGILLTNDFIIKLVDGNVAEDEILKMIANQPGRFSLEPADLARLKAAGVPDSIVAAMRDKK